jgi:hypothetical protein
VRGTSDVVELGWQLGFGFEAKLTWGDLGRCTHAYIGHWRSPKGLRFKLEVKSVFS